jgi:hypothetical protein
MRRVANSKKGGRANREHYMLDTLRSAHQQFHCCKVRHYLALVTGKGGINAIDPTAVNFLPVSATFSVYDGATKQNALFK